MIDESDYKALYDNINAVIKDWVVKMNEVHGTGSGSVAFNATRLGQACILPCLTFLSIGAACSDEQLEFISKNTLSKCLEVTKHFDKVCSGDK